MYSSIICILGRVTWASHGAFEILMWMALMGYLGIVLDELFFILPSALRVSKVSQRGYLTTPEINEAKRVKMVRILKTLTYKFDGKNIKNINL